mmetsp:Transcript_145573/g.405708  ORF Transcript_145573/g.405708 Transcript_145573/m.405708 type:complete len:195 (-) Transcript_145573:357-941(-)
MNLSRNGACSPAAGGHLYSSHSKHGQHRGQATAMSALCLSQTGINQAQQQQHRRQRSRSWLQTTAMAEWAVPSHSLIRHCRCHGIQGTREHVPTARAVGAPHSDCRATQTPVHLCCLYMGVRPKCSRLIDRKTTGTLIAPASAGLNNRDLSRYAQNVNSRSCLVSTDRIMMLKPVSNSCTTKLTKQNPHATATV